MTDDTNRSTPDTPDVERRLRDVYTPPEGAEETDRADAAVDGTSASHYGANDPALYESQDADTDE